MYLQIRSVLRVAACLVLAGGGGSQGRAMAGFYSATFITSTICNPTHRRNTLEHATTHCAFTFLLLTTYQLLQLILPCYLYSKELWYINKMSPITVGLVHKLSTLICFQDIYQALKYLLTIERMETTYFGIFLLISYLFHSKLLLFYYF